MIFTSESGLLDPSRGAEWDDWYRGHLAVMASVPGILSAQRFRALAAGPPPSLAMYTVASPAVFDSPHYLQVRGMGPWQELIDRRHYRRNLFAGNDAAPPAVSRHGILLVADRAMPQSAIEGLVWLQVVGLDRSVAYRGLAVLLDRGAAQQLAARLGGAALYQAITDRFGSGGQD
jgi:hypothetical protein